MKSDEEAYARIPRRMGWIAYETISVPTHLVLESIQANGGRITLNHDGSMEMEPLICGEFIGVVYRTVP